jgi:hypothetical protein
VDVTLKAEHPHHRVRVVREPVRVRAGVRAKAGVKARVRAKAEVKARARVGQGVFVLPYL